MTDSEDEGSPREGDHRTEDTEDTEDFFGIGHWDATRKSAVAAELDPSTAIDKSIFERQRPLHPRNRFRNRNRTRPRARTRFPFPLRGTNAFRSIESTVFRTAEHSSVVVLDSLFRKRAAGYFELFSGCWLTGSSTLRAFGITRITIP
jgi:hypothetical protein